MTTGGTGWGLWSNMPRRRAGRSGTSQSRSAGITRNLASRIARLSPRRDDRDDDRQAQRRAQWLQPVDSQRRSFFDGGHEADVHGARGAPLSAEIPQRERRYPSAAPSPAQLRI